MSSGCERLYGWSAVDDRAQPACLSAHAPRVEAGARERDNGDTIARPVVNYVSLAPATMHCSQDQPHLEERLLVHRQAYAEPRPCGKLGVCGPSKASLTPRRQAYHLPRLTRKAAASGTSTFCFFFTIFSFLWQGSHRDRADGG